MSASTEFRRLLLHAAELLAAQDGVVRAALGDAMFTAASSTRYNWNEARGKYSAYIAASTYAQLVMEMTARFLTDDDNEAGEPDPTAGG